jgi:uncharacterized protein (DUF934 family)
MPRQLLRDRQIVADDWHYAAEADGTATDSVIVDFGAFRTDRAAWEGRSGRLGVLLKPEHAVEDLVADLPRFALVACQFTGPGEGRGYTQAKLLRERFAFTGELRAMGYVRPDLLFFMARCGFNSFEMSDEDLKIALPMFETFSRAYQPSNDTGLAAKLQPA